MVVMAARIHLKHGIDSLALIKSLNLLRILPNLTQNLISGLVLLVSQRKIHALRPPLRFLRKDILLYLGIPEGAGHAAHAGEEIGSICGIQSKQSSHRIPNNPTPTWSSREFLFCRRNNFLRQKSQILVRTAGEGLGIFENRRAVPGRHVAVPVQIADCRQRKRRAADSPCRLENLLALA